MSIEVNHVSKIYGKQVALNDVSFKIKSPEVVGFLGPNGAGKSTMMKILTTYLEPDSGEVVVSGFSAKQNQYKIKQRVGYLSEQNPLYFEMYVREYLSFVAKTHKIKANRIENVIDITGLTPEAHKKIEQLSKGYKQRVGLAAALLHDPDVLILDEPTTGLDPNQLLEVRRLIKNLGKHKTVFLSTHIMQEVEAMCDRVIIIDKGKIVADKHLADLKKGQSQVIVVEFDYRVEDAFLLKLPNVKAVKNTFGFVYEITFSTDVDMRPSVFDFANSNQLKILQLNQKNNNLETLFRDLTS